MTLSPESIEAFRSAMGRQRRLVLLLTMAGWATVIAVMVWLSLNGAGLNFLWLVVYFAAVGPASLALMIFVLRRATRRMVDLLTVLAPRGRLIGAPSRGHDLIVLLDNDLVLRFRPAIAFRLFLSATGDPISPDLGEVRRWTATVRIRRVSQVTRRRGDSSLRAALDQISSRLDSRWARLDVLDRTRVDISNPRSPTRDALAVFFIRDPLKSGEAILRELDSIRQMLVEAASTSRVGLPRPIS